MKSKRFFLVMVGVLVLLSGVGAAALVMGNLMLGKKSKQLVQLKLENRLLEEQQVALKKAEADIKKYAELEKIAKSIVPQDKDQARAVREIIEIAKAAKMEIDTITFQSSSLGTQAPKPATPAPEEGGGAAAPATPSAPAAPPITQAKPVEGITGVYSVELNIQPKSAPYHSFLQFLKGLEKNRRTAHVASIKVSPKAAEGKIVGYDYQLTVNIFIKPGEQT